MSQLEDEEFGEFLQGPSPQCATQQTDQKKISGVLGNSMQKRTIDLELFVIDDKSEDGQHEKQVLDNFNVPLIQLADSNNLDVWSTQFVEPGNFDVWSTQFVEPANFDVWSAQFVEPANFDVWSAQFVEPANFDVWSTQFVDTANPDVLSAQHVDTTNPNVPLPWLHDTAIPDVLPPQLVDTTNPNVLSTQVELSPQLVDIAIHDVLPPQRVDTTNPAVWSPQLVDTTNPDLLLSPWVVDTSIPDESFTQLIDQTYNELTFTTDLTTWQTASDNENHEPKTLDNLEMKTIFDTTHISDEETFADFRACYDKCIPIQGSLPWMPDETNKCCVETGQEVADRCRHEWECCLRCCCQVMSEANSFLSSIKSSSICNEVLRSTQGLVYVSGHVEIYRIVCRVATSIQSTAISSTELEQTLKHIDIAWNNLTAFLAGASLLAQQEPPVSTHCVLKPDSEDSQNLACGVCLLSVDPAARTTSLCGETNNGKLTHFGRQYHATCANFWVNRVGQTLPTLTLSNLV